MERQNFMRVYESAEDYLEAILVITKRRGMVRSIDIANELGYSKPSVSIAMKKLRENGCVEVDGDGGIRLLPDEATLSRIKEHVRRTMAADKAEN